MTATNAITPPAAEITALTRWEALQSQIAIAQDEAKDAEFDYEARAGNREARSYIARLRRLRADIERCRKDAKAIHVERGKAVDHQAKALEASVLDLIAPHEHAPERLRTPALPAPASDGEREELAAWLEQDRGDHGIAAYAETRERLARAATLLRQPAPAPAAAPVPVAERPWERQLDWLTPDGECWWCPTDGPVYWSMADPRMVYDGWLLPHWAISIPQPPQGGEVQ